MANNIHVEILPQRTHSRSLLQRFALVSLAAVFLGSCGGGGGGGQGSSPPPNNSVTAVVNANGGAVELTDGTTVTFGTGIVKDETRITVSSTAQPSSDSNQEVQALSPTVVIDIPPDSLLTSAPADSVVTVKFPLTGSTTQNSVTGFSKATAAGILSGAATKIVQVAIKNIKGETLTYYGQLVEIALGKATVSIGSKIMSSPNIVDTIARITIKAMDAIQCTQQNTSLYQVDFPSGVEPAFSTNIQSNGKPPLILVHGWQELRIIGMSCGFPPFSRILS